MHGGALLALTCPKDRNCVSVPPEVSRPVWPQSSPARWEGEQDGATSAPRAERVDASSPYAVLVHRPVLGPGEGLGVAASLWDQL